MYSPGRASSAGTGGRTATSVCWNAVYRPARDVPEERVLIWRVQMGNLRVRKAERAEPHPCSQRWLLFAETLNTNALEQVDQLPSLSRVKRGHHLLAELALECLPLLDVAPPRRRELDQRRSTIARCRSTR